MPGVPDSWVYRKGEVSLQTDHGNGKDGSQFRSRNAIMGLGRRKHVDKIAYNLDREEKTTTPCGDPSAFRATSVRRLTIP